MSGILVWPPCGTAVTAQAVFGHPASGDWTSFRQEAHELAAQGVRSRLLQFGQGPRDLRDGRGAVRFREQCVSQVLEAAETLKRTCNAPISYVGKNLGAFVGGLAAARESPIPRFVLAAGVPDLTRFYLTSAHPVAVSAREGVSRAELREFESATSWLNPLYMLPQARAREIFFQWGLRDPWISRSEARQCVDAAPGPRTSRFYDDNHDFHGLAAREDRKGWVLGGGVLLHTGQFAASVRLRTDERRR